MRGEGVNLKVGNFTTVVFGEYVCLGWRRRFHDFFEFLRIFN